MDENIMFIMFEREIKDRKEKLKNSDLPYESRGYLLNMYWDLFHELEQEYCKQFNIADGYIMDKIFKIGTEILFEDEEDE